MMSLPPLAINGRFLTRRVSGVERVARELVRALAALYSEAAQLGDLSILVEHHRSLPDTFEGVAILPTGRFHGQLWEQLDLPTQARRTWLLNPCNLGPLLRRKSIVIFHDAQTRLTPDSYSRRMRLWYGFIQPLIGHSSQIIVSPSDYSRSTLEATNVVPAGKVVVIPNGANHMAGVAADPELLRRRGLTPHGYVLAVGGAAKHKNLAILARAAASRQYTEVPIVVAGDVGAAFPGQNPPGQMKFLGRVSDEGLKTLYANALCLAFPSTIEGFGLPALEAMSLGCPVIASNAGSIPEVCGDAVLFADPNDASQWAAALDRLVSDAALRSDLAERGQRRAAQFTWSSMAAAIVSLISSRQMI